MGNLTVLVVPLLHRDHSDCLVDEDFILKGQAFFGLFSRLFMILEWPEDDSKNTRFRNAISLAFWLFESVVLWEQEFTGFWNLLLEVI